MKQTLKQQEDFISALFGEEPCYKKDADAISVNELDEAISDCKMLLAESIHRDDREEISFWRKMLQENKVQRRELLTT